VKIAVDLDGVLYEWQRTFRYMMREYRGVDMPPVEDFWFFWDAAKQYGTKEDHAWIWDEGVKRGLFRYGHVVKDGRRVLERLHDKGHKLIVVTHRPEAAVTDTIAWLDLYFKDIPLAGLHIFSNMEPKESVEADVLIDDKPENIAGWITAGRNAILFDQPWNQDYHGGYRAVTWRDVERIVDSWS
jgi:5'(3')-deoxyribonucleotidase